MGVVNYGENDVIFMQGSIGSEAFLVNSGVVGIFLNYGKENVRKLSEISEGLIFGEMAMLENMSRSATAVALTECEILSFSEHDLLALFEKYPAVQLKLIKQLSGRLRNVTQNYDEVCTLLAAIVERNKAQREYLNVTRDQNEIMRRRLQQHAEEKICYYL